MKYCALIFSTLLLMTSTSCSILQGDPCKDYEPFTATSNSPVTTGQQIELSASYLPAAVYQWTGPHGFTSFSQDTTILYANAGDVGSYKVTVTANNCDNIPAAFTNVAVNYPDVPCAPSTDNALFLTGGSKIDQYSSLGFSAADGVLSFGQYNFDSQISICLRGDSLPAYDDVYEIGGSYCGDFLDGNRANVLYTNFYYYTANSGTVYAKVFTDKITLTFCDVSFGPFSVSGTFVYNK